MCSPRNTGNINFSVWLTGGLSQVCPDFQKVYVFKVYVPFSCPSIVFFPVLKPLACGRQSRCLGWTYKLPRGQKFSIKLSPLSIGFPKRKPLNLIKKTGVYKPPRGAIYKPPRVQLINNPFFAIHQVFALSISGTKTPRFF